MMPGRAFANCSRGRVDSQRCLHCKGGVLFEAMLAVALFVGAAAFTLACVRNVTRTLERTRLKQEAVDLARSRMAELEAGLTTLSGLRGEADTASDDETAAFEADEEEAVRWRIDVSSARSEFANLTLIEVTVTENLSTEAEAAGENPMRFTLRQLVALREDAGEAFEVEPALGGGVSP
jgi:hypothetical protein